MSAEGIFEYPQVFTTTGFAKDFLNKCFNHLTDAKLEEAIRFCDFTNNEHVGAEPVLWLPWGIIEYKI